jgi:hypothetical protein
VRRTEGFAGTTSTAASSTAAPLDQAETAAARARLADTLIGRQALLIVDTNEQVARLSAQLHADLAGSATSTTRPAWSHSWSEVGSSRVAVDP